MALKAADFNVPPDILIVPVLSLTIEVFIVSIVPPDISTVPWFIIPIFPETLPPVMLIVPDLLLITYKSPLLSISLPSLMLITPP